MGLFGKLFGGGKKVYNERVETKGNKIPISEVPVDERFIIYFKRNGGKFIYCEDFNQVLRTFSNIVSENNWQGKYYYTLDKRLKERFSAEQINFTSNRESSNIFFTTCEHLVAKDGSILVCSHQIGEHKIAELPTNMIFFATTSQLVENIGEALKVIKKRYGKDIPDNITTLKHFLPTAENENDFLSYGSKSKNIYLVLMEDF